MNEPVILSTVKDMRSWRGTEPGLVGFVPTMGALHRGHAELLRRLRARCDRLVLSIFVNPTQFGPKEDLAKYPRTFESDLAVARECGVDAVFFPSPEEIYPPGYSTFVVEEQLTVPLCGEVRPGHFRGVTTVVLKLFNLVQPHTAYFGMKDAQQFFVLHKMVKDLNLDVSIEGVTTVREPSGLALSSRNRYLSAGERELAPRLYGYLSETSRKLAEGARIDSSLLELKHSLVTAGFKPQYVECVKLPDLSHPREACADPAIPYLIAVAVFLGSTRLIDNLILRPALLGGYGIQTHGE